MGDVQPRLRACVRFCYHLAASSAATTRWRRDWAGLAARISEPCGAHLSELAEIFAKKVTR